MDHTLNQKSPMFTNRELVTLAVPIAIEALFSIYSFAFIPMNAFRAAGDVRYPLVVSLTSMFVFRIGLAFLLAKVFHLGLMSVWIGMWADWIFRAILNMFRIRGDRWLNKKNV